MILLLGQSKILHNLWQRTSQRVHPRPLFLQINLLLQQTMLLSILQRKLLVLRSLMQPRPLFLQRNKLLVLLRSLLQPRVLPSLLQPRVQLMMQPRVQLQMQPRVQLMVQLVQARMLVPLVGHRSGKWLRFQRRPLPRVQRSSSPSKALRRRTVRSSLRRKVQHQHGLRPTQSTYMVSQC
jgi:hypothetical protein